MAETDVLFGDLPGVNGSKLKGGIFSNVSRFTLLYNLFRQYFVTVNVFRRKNRPSSLYKYQASNTYWLY